MSSFDSSTMQSLISQGSMLDYTARKSYVNNYLMANGNTSKSNTLTDQLAAEKAKPSYQLVKKQTSAGTFVTGAQDLIGALKTASSNMTESTGMQATSDGPSVTAGTVKKGATEQSYTLNVTSLAQKQQNDGTSLSNTGHDFTLGENSINVNGKAVVFTVLASDNNQKALASMAKAINTANVGVTASVNADGTTKSLLSLQSNKTGTDGVFTVASAGKNDVVALTGVNKEKTAAQNALYSVDGGRTESSQTNQISLQNGNVNLTLSKADGKNTNVTVGKATSATLDNITNFVNQFNTMVGAANANASNPTSFASGLADRLRQNVNGNASALRDLGITFKTDGQMTIDSKKLTNAITNSPDQVKKVFGADSEFMKKTNSEVSAMEKLAKPSSNQTYYAYDFVAASGGITSQFMNKQA